MESEITVFPSAPLAGWCSEKEVNWTEGERTFDRARATFLLFIRVLLSLELMKFILLIKYAKISKITVDLLSCYMNCN